jgi:hypothetical protein
MSGWTKENLPPTPFHVLAVCVVCNNVAKVVSLKTNDQMEWREVVCETPGCVMNGIRYEFSRAKLRRM